MDLSGQRVLVTGGAVRIGRAICEALAARGCTVMVHYRESEREAIALIADGVCDATTIDDVVKLGFGARMAVLGPMEQSDLVGLDLTLAIHDSLMPRLDRTAGAHPYLIEKVDKGELGMNAGAGFRTWTPAAAKAVRDRLDQWNTRMSPAEGDPEPLKSERTL